MHAIEATDNTGRMFADT